MNINLMKKGFMVRLKLLSLILFLLMNSTYMFSQSSKEQKAFNKMVDGLISSTVPVISVEELAQKGLESYTILDAREWDEFQTSHLAGATWVGYNNLQKQVVGTLAKDKPVVVYCSVGYRSEKIGEQLEKMGFGEVLNLYGGIFDWVNHDMPLVDSEGKATAQVHAYDKKWGKWLQKGEKIY